MPHNFFSLPAVTPNPGRVTRGRVHQVCSGHGGKLEGFWLDSPDSPATAYVLVRDGDADAIRADLHATMHLGPLHEGD